MDFKCGSSVTTPVLCVLEELLVKNANPLVLWG